MLSRPLFSVVIPIYNTEKYLKRCIQSVINQKNDKTEIILVEDCSTDRSLKVCNSFKKNKSINIIRHQKNLGVSISRNDGILAAQGKYILFLDSDDWLYPGCLRSIEKLQKKNSKSELIIGRYNSDGYPPNNKILFENTNVTTFSANKFFSYINRINFRPMIIWPYIIKKSLITKKKIYFVDVKNGEDEEFGARLLCSIKFVTFYIKNYYWHKKRIQGHLRYSRDLKSTESYLKLLVEYYIFVSNKKLSIEKQKFINECVRFAYGEFSARIIICNKLEIKKLNSILKRYRKNSKILLNKIKNKNIYLLLKKKNVFQHKNLIMKNILNKIKNTEFKFSRIYIYCAAIHGVATLNILYRNRIKVTALIDDNLDIEKQTFIHNVDIITSKFFFKKIKKHECSNILILVCQQTLEVFNDIAKKIMYNGIKANQIINIRY
jgi:glycosyltransferase involved in cell wall biosynthesis